MKGKYEKKLRGLQNKMIRQQIMAELVAAAKSDDK